MSNDGLSVESRLDLMAAELRRLSERVEQLSVKIGAATCSPAAIPAAPADDWDTQPALPLRLPDWTGAEMLAGAARFCFILVAALVLRTFVDNRMIGLHIGAVMGFVYASLIVVYGFYRLKSRRRYASLFAICGLLLAFAIVLEMNFRFEILSARAGHGVLIAMMVLVLAGGLRYRAFTPLQVAIPGVTFIAMSFRFPDPPFVSLALLLACATIVSYAVTWNAPTRWLTWFLYVSVSFVWLWWTVKVRFAMVQHAPANPELAAQWFMPALFVCIAGYSALVLWAALRESWPFGVFESMLPSVNAVICYWAALTLARTAGSSTAHIAWVGILIALAYVALATWLARVPGKRVAAATAFALAALLIVPMSLPEISGDARLTVLIMSCVAVCFARFGQDRLNSTIQFAALLLQGYSCALGVSQWLFETATPGLMISIGVLIVLSTICAYHYAWLRREATAPPRYLHNFALLAFVGSVIYAFSASRMILYVALTELYTDIGAAFVCGQSVIINFGALLLAILGLRRKNREFILIAFVVAAIGGSKVFLFDLLRTQGAPLVVSVLSFGITATAGSLIWNRWYRMTAAQPPETGESLPNAELDTH